MPSQRRVVLDHVAQVGVGPLDGGGELRRAGRGPATSSSRRGQGGDGDGAGDLAGGVPAHAVGDDEQARPGVAGVLVALAEQPDVGARGEAQGQRHRALPPQLEDGLADAYGGPDGDRHGGPTFVRSR